MIVDFLLKRNLPRPGQKEKNGHGDGKRCHEKYNSGDEGGPYDSDGAAGCEQNNKFDG